MAEPYNPDEENDSNFIHNMEIDEDTDLEWDTDTDDDDDDDEEEEEEEENSPVVDSARVSRNIDLNSGLDENSLLIGDENSESKEWNRIEIEGLLCSICMDCWTGDGDHHICCLPCGHIYGLSCIRKWLKQKRSSGQCPQCNMKCSLKDVRKLFAPRIAAVDNESQKIIRSLEVKCFVLEKKNADSSRKESELRKNNAELQDRVKQLIEERRQVEEKVDRLNFIVEKQASQNSMLVEQQASKTQKIEVSLPTSAAKEFHMTSHRIHHNTQRVSFSLSGSISLSGSLSLSGSSSGSLSFK